MRQHGLARSGYAGQTREQRVNGVGYNLPRFALGAARLPRHARGMRILVALVILVGTAHAERDERDPIRLRAGTLAIEGSRYMKDMAQLAAAIEKRTRGSVQLDWVADGQLGEEADMAKLVVSNKLDGGGFSETGLVSLVPEMATWGEPGRFHTYDDVDTAFASHAAKLRERFAKKDLVLVMWADLGFARVFSREPMTNMAATLRASKADLVRPIDGVLASAIASGALRTWAVPPLYMVAIGNQARYMSNLRYRYVVGALVFSKRAWSRLSSTQQASVLDVCRAWEPKIRASWRKETERGIAALGKAGVTTNAATDADIAAFVELTSTRTEL
jgi:TRAP-type C4-dicarboxylate transport system substrate-binding protein